MSLSEQLRDKIRASGKSANQLAREIGIPQPTITTFLNGSDVRLETANKLAAYFGLRLCDDPPAATAKSKVKAPAMPAVDWGASEPAKKRKPDVPPGPAKPKRRA
jgi:transcriptional regulator with XRE-family HTH domain